MTERQAGKLGRAPTILDKRTIRISKIFTRELAPVPQSYNVEKVLAELYGLTFPDRMWRNDLFGDCVIAARANESLKYEAFEQHKIININDEDVLRTYFSETGGLDSGLNMLRSLSAWRKGWTIDRKTRCKFFGTGGTKYDIYAYAAIDSIEDLKKSLFYLRSGYVGFDVPKYCIDQFNAHKVWDLNPDGDQTIAGGHCISMPAYGLDGGDELLFFRTWGWTQPMTPRFYNKWVSEAYAIIDKPDAWLGEESPIKLEELAAILAEITGG